MVRQIIIVLVSLGFIIISLVLFGVIGKKPEVKKKPETAQPPKMVQTFTVANKEIQTKINIYGRLVSYEKTEIFAEVGGMLVSTGRPFKEGIRFNKGELLLRIEDTEQQLNLRAQRAALLTVITQMMPDIKIDFSENLEAWDGYRKNFDVEKPLEALPTPKSDREKDYVTLKNIYNQYYTIKGVEERLGKYNIYAPFGGELTEALINTGSLIRAGQKIGTLMNTGVYELQASVPLQDLKYLKVGDRVTLQSEDVKGNWVGGISRIAGSIDTKTQTVKLYIQVSGTGLRENMFLTGEINANTVANVIEVPRKLLVNNEKIYTVVGDSSLALIEAQIVKIGETSAMLRGIPDGTKILSEAFPGIFAGMKVKTMSE